MILLKNIEELTHYRNSLATSATVGFVPTMGALHAGHLSLIDASKNNDVTIVSIFVNPLQFNNPSDFEKYLNRIEEDLKKLEKTNCNAVFLPSAQDLYPEKPLLSFDFGALSSVLEGEFRPGHFSGVAIVVSKLFHLVNPHFAYFGEKDLQQLKIIEALVRDLSMKVNIVPCPTLREEGGLAMSSRNLRLNTEQRERALDVIAFLQKAKSLLGTISHEQIEGQLANEILQKQRLKLNKKQVSAKMVNSSRHTYNYFLLHSLF